ncbi:MAG: universal stress protein [Acidimicrobiales bacterium]
MAYNQILMPETAGTPGPATPEVAQRLAEVLNIEVQLVDADSAKFLAELDHHPDSLVVMGARGRSRAGGLLGELAEDVLHHTGQPIVLVGPHAFVSSDWPRGPLMLCSDGTPFAETMAIPSAAMAKSLGVEPRVVSVTSGPPRGACVDASTPTGSMSSLNGLVESIIGREVHCDLLHGTDPAAVIVEHAHWYGASLVALTTHSRTGLPRMRTGSIAMKVINLARCPVLLKNPEPAAP